MPLSSVFIGYHILVETEWHRAEGAHRLESGNALKLESKLNVASVKGTGSEARGPFSCYLAAKWKCHNISVSFWFYKFENEHAAIWTCPGSRTD